MYRHKNHLFEIASFWKISKIQSVSIDVFYG